jgi:hypothetical protein
MRFEKIKEKQSAIYEEEKEIAPNEKLEKEG